MKAFLEACSVIAIVILATVVFATLEIAVIGILLVMGVVGLMVLAYRGLCRARP